MKPLNCCKGCSGLKNGEFRNKFRCIFCEEYAKELNLKFPEEYVDNLKGKDVLFVVKLNKINRKVLPELNVEFFKDAALTAILL